MSDKARAQALINALVAGTKETADTPARTGRTPTDTNPFENLKPGEIWVSFEDGRAAVRADNSRFGLDSAGVYVYIAQQVQPDKGFIITKLDIERNNAAFGNAARNLLPGATRAVHSSHFLPLLVLPDNVNGGLHVRILRGWTRGYFVSESTLLLVPTATANSQAWIMVGYDLTTQALTQTLTADRSLVYSMQEIDCAATIRANPDVFWLAAVAVANGATTLDPANFIDLRFFNGTATDISAVHVNVANEISTITEKTSIADDDLLIIEDSAASGVKKKVKASNLPGASTLSQFPTRATMWHADSLALTGNAILRQVESTAFYGTRAYQNTAAVNDEFTNSFVSIGGSYTLVVYGARGTNLGIVTWYIDGVSQGTMDMYNASGSQAIRYTLSVTVVGEGYHVLRGVVASKHASSSDYFAIITQMAIVPSAD